MMRQRPRSSPRRLPAIAAVATVCLAACTTNPPLISRLDSSGLTVVTLGDAVVLARPVHRLAAGARDYAYIGPIRVNRMGRLEHFVWIGFASTIDREFVNASPTKAVTLALVIDGQPMILALDEWSTHLDRSPYETAAPVYATSSARASLDQIQRIAGAASVEAHFISSTGAVARYRAWEGDWSSWSMYVNAE